MLNDNRNMDSLLKKGVRIYFTKGRDGIVNNYNKYGCLIHDFPDGLTQGHSFIGAPICPYSNEQRVFEGNDAVLMRGQNVFLTQFNIITCVGIFCFSAAKKHQYDTVYAYHSPCGYINQSKVREWAEKLKNPEESYILYYLSRGDLLIYESDVKTICEVMSIFDDRIPPVNHCVYIDRMGQSSATIDGYFGFQQKIRLFSRPLRSDYFNPLGSLNKLLADQGAEEIHDFLGLLRDYQKYPSKPKAISIKNMLDARMVVLNNRIRYSEDRGAFSEILEVFNKTIVQYDFWKKKREQLIPIIRSIIPSPYKAKRDIISELIAFIEYLYR
jgi:hypothetical protein